MNRYFPIAFLLLGLLSCDETDLPLLTDCGPLAKIMDEDGTVISDPFQIIDVDISGKCLSLTIGSGGCSGDTWEGHLLFSPFLAESYPPQIQGWFQFKDEEMCEAYFEKTFTFDLSELDQFDSPLIINLNGWEESIPYPDFNTSQLLGDSILYDWKLVMDRVV